MEKESREAKASILHDLINRLAAAALEEESRQNAANGLLNSTENVDLLALATTSPLYLKHSNNSRVSMASRSLQDNEINAFINSNNLSEASSLTTSSGSNFDINIALTIVYLIIFLIGVIGNVCNCLVIADGRNRDMKTPTNYYLFSLSVSDLLLLIFGLPHDLINLWHPNGYMFNQFVCISRGWISEASTNASVLVIVAFSMERYLAICHPLKAHKWSHLSRSIKIICLIWLVASTCAFVVVWQYGLVQIDDKQSDGSLTGSVWQCTMVSQGKQIFELSVFIFFILPMTIITIVYLKLAYHLRKKSKLHSSRVGGNAPKSNYNQSPQKQQQNINQQGNRSALERTRFSSFRQIATGAEKEPSCTLKGPVKLAQRKSSEHLIVANSMVNKSAGNLEESGRLAQHSHQHPMPLSNQNGTKSNEVAQHCDKSGHRLLITDCEQVSPPITIEHNSTLPDDYVIQQQQQHQSSSQLNNVTSELTRKPQWWLSSNTLISRLQKLNFLFSESQKRAKIEESDQLERNSNFVTLNKSNSIEVILSSVESASKQRRSVNSMHLANDTSWRQNLNINYFKRQADSTLNVSPAHSSAGSNATGAARISLNSNVNTSNLNSVFKMLVSVVVMFFICWAPFHAQRLMAVYVTEPTSQQEYIFGLLNHISGISYYISAVANPILYSLYSRKFRQAFWDTFRCFGCANN